ncbi:MAG: NAD(+) diphosphatase [Gammaproteobacteria bacterium]|nr:NAD(+) diphosphatase [Gammaproteobacteria bacterium]
MSIPHVFCGDLLDRADHQRRDPDWVSARLSDPRSRFLALSGLNPLVHAAPPNGGEPRLAWQGPELAVHAATHAQPVLLGLDDDVAHFAIDVGADFDAQTGLGLTTDTRFEDARAIATELPVEQAGTLAHAKSLVDWHARHRFCANCGAITEPRNGGKERRCPQCAHHHYPRTDPVVIMVVTDGQRCLLGRSRRRPTGRYSALAGFVDQGESIEEAVRREVKEEADIDIGEVRYHSSQPWPFPSSLMIGCIARALSTEIRIDDVELADVRWFSRDEVREAYAQGQSPGEGLRLPGRIAIAHHIIKAWLEGG